MAEIKTTFWFDLFLPLKCFSIVEHDHFKVLPYLKATLYYPKTGSKYCDVLIPNMLFILGLTYHSDYRCYVFKCENDSYNCLVKTALLKCFASFYSSKKSHIPNLHIVKDLSRERKLLDIINLFKIMFFFLAPIHDLICDPICDPICGPISVLVCDLVRFTPDLVFAATGTPFYIASKNSYILLEISYH